MRKPEYTFEEMMNIREQYTSVLIEAQSHLTDYVETQAHLNAYSSMVEIAPEVSPVWYDSENVYFEYNDWFQDGPVDSITMPLAFVYSSDYRARTLRESKDALDKQVRARRQAKQKAADALREERLALYEKLKKEFE